MISYLITLVILGIFQGITEFIPISSSGHLALLLSFPIIADILVTADANISMMINIVLHFATLIAILYFLKKDIWTLLSNFILSIYKRDFSNTYFLLSLKIVAASIPVAIIGILFKSFFEIFFNSMLMVGIFLILNSFILIYTKKIKIKNIEIEQIGFSRAFIIGLFQILALCPGISRSGTTIATGLFLGLKPEDSARFSFLILIPAITGASLLEILKIKDMSLPNDFYIALIVAFIITIVVAYFSMIVLFKLVKKIKLDYFGYYTATIGVLIIVYSFLS
jgi:undecaprenyl-diphosphatase